MISFNCKNPNCGKNQIVQLYPSNSEDIPSLHYKCPNCKCGDMNFQMILNEKAMKKKNKNINVNANINQSLYNEKKAQEMAKRYVNLRTCILSMAFRIKKGV